MPTSMGRNMGEAGMVEITVIDTGTGRTATVGASASTTVKEALGKGYNEMGETQRADDHFYDGKGNNIDDRLDEPVGKLAGDQDGIATVEIRHPTGGGARPSFRE